MRRHAVALVILAVLVGSASASCAAGYNLPITVGPRDCAGADAKGRPAFRYTVSWPSPGASSVSYIVSSPNGCRLDGKACSGGGPDCIKVCRGACNAQLSNCSTSGVSWAQVSTPDQSLVSKREAATGPAGKCLNSSP